MDDENSNSNATFVFTSAAIRYVAPSFSRLDISHLMGLVSGQLCALNHEAQPNDALLELHGVYVYEINELCNIQVFGLVLLVPLCQTILS